MRARWFSRVRAGALLAALAAALVLPAAAVAQAPEDAINPLDTLALSVARWNSANGEMVPLAWFASELKVAADGTLMIPVLGEVDATGLSRGELVEEIGSRLEQALGITDRLYVTITVSEHGPIYVVGAVQNPGRFEYIPGLTALQAIALAGGPLREQSFFSRTERDAVRALGDRRLLVVERAAQLARIARLEAEADGRDDVDMPPELEGAENAEELMAVEREVLAARRDEHESALAAIGDLKETLRLRIEKLEEEVALREKLLDATREERDNIETLVKRGLSRQSQVNEVARALAELEARVLELQSSILTAQQQLSEAERDRLELIGRRRVTIVTELQEARADLDGINSRMETAEALFSEAARFGSTLDAMKAEHGPVRPVLLLTRAQDGDTQTHNIDERTSLRPGDVLQVEAPELAGGITLELPGSGSAFSGAAASPTN